MIDNMKKIFIMLFSFTLALSINAQTIKVYENDQLVKIYHNTDDFTYEVSVSQPWIQMWEDGPLWALSNVGADGSMTAPGGLYKWNNGLITLGTDEPDIWQIPTRQDFVDLKNKCDWKWVTEYDGRQVQGLLFTGKGDFAKNQLFLPQTGWIDGGSTNSYGCYYMTSTKTYENEENKRDCLKYDQFDSSAPKLQEIDFKYNNKVAIRPILRVE